MLFYSFVNFFVASLLFVFGKEIYFGRTDMIQQRLQKNVKDKEAYGKAFGKAMIVTGVGPFLSSLIVLAGFEKVSIVTLIIGLAIGIGMIIAAQIKYNGGII